MSALLLKLIACLTMLIDHVGYFNGVSLLRCIGRIAFPIFALLIARGYEKTSNPYKYLARLLLFGLITEPFYDYCFLGGFYVPEHSNVMFTLALGLLAVLVLDKLSQCGRGWKTMSIIVVFIIAWAADRLGTDYGLFGVLLVVALYAFRGETISRRLLTTGAVILFAFRNVILYGFADSGWMQLFAAAALPFILFYNGKRGFEPKTALSSCVSKYGFYAFYPVHIFILSLLFRRNLLSAFENLWQLILSKI